MHYNLLQIRLCCVFEDCVVCLCKCVCVYRKCVCVYESNVYVYVCLCTILNSVNCLCTILNSVNYKFWKNSKICSRCHSALAELLTNFVVRQNRESRRFTWSKICETTFGEENSWYSTSSTINVLSISQV